MTTVGVLCEGQTEENMVREFLGPELSVHGIYLVPTLLETRNAAGGPSHRGGVSKWSKIERDLRRLLGSSHWAAVTALLDFYGLPHGSPGMADRPTTGPRRLRVEYVEQRIAEHIDDPRFIPHVVLHETETWVFAAAEQLGELLEEPALVGELKRQADENGGAEEVDDGPDTAPSKRLVRLLPRIQQDPGRPRCRDASRAGPTAAGLPSLRHLDQSAPGTLGAFVGSSFGVSPCRTPPTS